MHEENVPAAHAPCGGIVSPHSKSRQRMQKREVDPKLELEGSVQGPNITRVSYRDSRAQGERLGSINTKGQSLELKDTDNHSRSVSSQQVAQGG